MPWKQHALERDLADRGDLFSRIRGRQTAFARFACRVVEGRWQVDYLDVVVGVPPVGWRSEAWVYPDASLVARTMSLASLRRLLDVEAKIRLAGRDVVLPALSPQCPQVERRPGRGGAVDPDLALPHLMTRLFPEGLAPHNSSARLLVGTKSPPFLNEDVAWASFFERRHSSNSRWRSSSELVRLRWVDDRAWFSRVGQSVAGLEITVAGAGASECHVDVNGDGLRWRGELGSQGNLIVPFPNGLPSDCLVVLAHRDRWMDFRVLNQGFGSAIESDIVHLDEATPQEELEGYLYQGEGVSLEFKRQIPRNDKERQRIARTAAAFANGDGGSFVFGIEPDEVTLAGVDSSAPTTMRDSVQRILTERVTPPPAVEVRLLEALGRTFVVAYVRPGATPPYAENPHSPTYYVRRGASTVPAHPEELRALLAARSSGVVPRWGP